MNGNVLSSSKYFNLIQVREGIYAAIIKEGMGAWGNAGVIDLGDTTLIFDTFLTPEAAKELKKVAIEVTGNSVSYVVNSHWHIDHILGNQVFKGAHIISTERTRELIETRIDFSNPDVKIASLSNHIQDLRNEVDRQKDIRIKEALKNEIVEKTHYMNAIHSINLTLPTLTFHNKLVIHGSKRTIEIMSLGGGHTPSDTFAYLPAERIAFMGDLVFVNTQPSIHAQPLAKWISILKKLNKMEIEKIIPGHGPIGNKEEIDKVIKYLEDLLRIMKEFVESGRSESELDSISVPKQYEDWDFPHVFTWNVKNIWKMIN